MYARATIPGVRVQHFLYSPGTSVSSVRPCHNARNFSALCNTPPYPYPESTNATEHNLAIFVRMMNIWHRCNPLDVGHKSPYLVLRESRLFWRYGHLKMGTPSHRVCLYLICIICNPILLDVGTIVRKLKSGFRWNLTTDVYYSCPCVCHCRS